jgi:DUF917 family protein
MRLSVQDVEGVAVGGAILDTGGGGGVGKLVAQRAIEEYGSPEMIPLKEIPDNNIVMIASRIGAPAVLVEKILRGDEKSAIGTYVLGAGS